MWTTSFPHAHTIADATAAAEALTCWHDTVTRTPDGTHTARPISAMLAWFDEAHTIVAYNGRGFDMRVLRQYYDGDDDR